MDERAQYFLQTLEQIGSPLMGAIIATSKVSGPEGAAADAQAMAIMLGKVVQASIDLGKAMGVNPVEIGDDSLRVALAGLASPLVAAQMRQAGAVPEDAEVARIVSALQAVLTFSDNFTPSADNAQRLADLQARGQSVDAHQASVQYVLAFVPVVQAISGFSFGQAPQKLIVEVSNRLVKRVAEVREVLVPEASGDDQKRLELGFLAALAQIYAACHEAETQKASGMSEGAGPSLDSVWAAFDMQAAMLEVLSNSFVPASGASQTVNVSGGSGVSPVAAAPVEPPAAAAPVSPPPVAVAPPTQAAAPPVAQAASPLSTFAKKPAEAAAPVAPPVQQEAPPAAAVQESAVAPAAAGANPMSMFAKPQAEKTAPAAAPVAPPPAAAEEQASDEGESAGGGGSPMSFFKKDE